MIEFKREQADGAHEYLQIVRLDYKRTFVSEALGGKRSPFIVQITSDSGGHGDFVGVFDLDGDKIDAHGLSWEIADDVPAEVIETVETGWADCDNVLTRAA